MARIDTLQNFLQDVADSIKSKKNIETKLKPENFDTEIASIQGGSISSGIEVGVEAQTNIAKGDRFVGVKNDSSVDKRVVVSPLGITFGVISTDLSVGFPNQQLGDNEKLPIYFLNENGGYDIYFLNIPQISEVRTALGNPTTAIYSTSIKINDDGTYGFIDFNSVFNKTTKGLDHYVGLITFNKELKEATFEIIKNPLGDVSFSLQQTNSSNIYDLHSITAINNCYFHDNLLFCNIKCNMVYEGTDASTNVQAIIEIPTFNINYKGGYGSAIGTTYCSAKTENGYYLIGSSSGVHKFSKNEYFGVGGAQIKWISKNGKFGCTVNTSKYQISLYSIDSVGVGTTLIKTSSTLSSLAIAPYPSEDGTRILTPVGVYDENFNQVFSQSLNAPTNNLFTPNKWISGSSMFSISPVSNQEYLISKTDSTIIESNKVYGVASEELLAGNSGTARMLFSTLE